MEDVRLLNVFDVGELLKVSPKTVRKLVRQGEIVTPLRVGRSIRFCQADLLAWLRAGCPKPTRV